jgi:CRISPR-associated endoribonuclease Cas6
MPATYWIPLESVSLPIKAEHLHAVVTSWFDAWAPAASDGIGHQETEKPYTASPATEFEGQVGVQVSVLTEEAESFLHRAARPGAPVRFGSMVGHVGEPACTNSASWSELMRARPARAWLIEFDSPTCFRSGERTSVLPIPALLLRTPSALWQRWSPIPLEPLTGDDHRALFISHARLETVDYRLADKNPVRSRAHEPHDVSGIVGAVRLVTHGATASKVEPLLRLAEFGGIGAYTRRGMGVVTVIPEE